MGLFEAIEKLINEHGSAVILKERIALVKEQYEALERRTRELQVENERLRTEHEDLTARNAELEQRLAEADKGEIDESALNILAALSRAKHGLTGDRIACDLRIPEPRVEYYLHELYKNGLLTTSGNYGTGERWWHIGQEGRRHLVRRGLL